MIVEKINTKQHRKIIINIIIIKVIIKRKRKGLWRTISLHTLPPARPTSPLRRKKQKSKNNPEKTSMCCIAMAGQTTLNKKQCYHELSINSLLDEDFKKNILFLVNTTIDDRFKK